jgi:hypothetical protein
MSRKPGAAPPSAGVTYEVGYGKPPQHSRFKPGHSGNPRGRDKGSLNLDTLLDKALGQMVTIKEQGTSRLLTKREMIITQLVNKAAAGSDLRAIRLLIELDRRREVYLAGKSDACQGDRHSGVQMREVEPDLPDLDSMSTAELEVLFEATLIMDGKKTPPPVPMPPPDPGKAREHPPMPTPPADPGAAEE